MLKILSTEKPDLQNYILSSFVVMSVAILSSPLFNSSPFNTSYILLRLACATHSSVSISMKKTLQVLVACLNPSSSTSLSSVLPTSVALYIMMASVQFKSAKMAFRKS